MNDYRKLYSTFIYNIHFFNKNDHYNLEKLNYIIKIIFPLVYFNLSMKLKKYQINKLNRN